MAGFALREVLRKKVLTVGAILTGVYLLLFGLGLHFVRGQIRMLEQVVGMQFLSMGLYVATFLTAVIAAFAGVGAVSGEIESGTAFALLANPVSRTQILLGKFLGYALLLGFYATLFFLSLWGLTEWQFGISLPGALAALPLFLLQTWVMLGVSFLGSTLLSTLTNGIAIFLLYGIALVGGLVEQIGSMVSQFSNATMTTLINIGIVSSLLLPVDALYRRSVYILLSKTGTPNIFQNLGPFGCSSVPSVWMVVYAVVYLLACLLFAVRFFKRGDI